MKPKQGERHWKFARRNQVMNPSITLINPNWQQISTTFYALLAVGIRNVDLT
jgi:hypothetical protein